MADKEDRKEILGWKTLRPILDNYYENLTDERKILFSHNGKPNYSLLIRASVIRFVKNETMGV